VYLLAPSGGMSRTRQQVGFDAVRHRTHTRMGQGGSRSVDKSGRCQGGKDIPCSRQDGEGLGKGHLAKCSLVRGSEVL